MARPAFRVSKCPGKREIRGQAGNRCWSPDNEVSQLAGDGLLGIGDTAEVNP